MIWLRRRRDSSRWRFGHPGDLDPVPAAQVADEPCVPRPAAIGQLLFLGAAVVVIFALRRIRPKLPFLTDGFVRLAPAYVIGGISAYWLVERIAGVF